MESRSRFVAPERMGAWVAVAFGLAILALITAIWGVREARAVSAVTQVQILKLDERLRALEGARSAAPAATTPAPAPAEPAPAAQ